MIDVHCPHRICRRLFARLEEATGEVELFCKNCKSLTHFSLLVRGPGDLHCFHCQHRLGSWNGTVFSRRCRFCKQTNRYVLRHDGRNHSLVLHAHAFRGSIVE